MKLLHLSISALLIYISITCFSYWFLYGYPVIPGVAVLSPILAIAVMWSFARSFGGLAAVIFCLLALWISPKIAAGTALIDKLRILSLQENFPENLEKTDVMPLGLNGFFHTSISQYVIYRPSDEATPTEKFWENLPEEYKFLNAQGYCQPSLRRVDANYVILLSAC